MNELDAYLTGALEPPDYHSAEGQSPGHWEPQNDDQADWCLRKLKDVEDQLVHKRTLYQRQREHLDEWLAQVTAPLERESSHWRGLLERYAIRQRLTTGAKTLRLPNGELTTRTKDRGGAIEIAEKDALAGWLQSHPDLEAAWCHRDDPEPQITKIRPQVQVVAGAVCMHCGSPIVRSADANMGHWVAAQGLTCPQGGGHHLPAANADGEIVSRSVVVYDGSPVPGLGVREETVAATVSVWS